MAALKALMIRKGALNIKREQQPEKIRALKDLVAHHVIQDASSLANDLINHYYAGWHFVTVWPTAAEGETPIRHGPRLTRNEVVKGWVWIGRLLLADSVRRLWLGLACLGTRLRYVLRPDVCMAVPSSAHFCIPLPSPIVVTFLFLMYS